MASESLVSLEWARAQQVQLSVDLISAAKQELGFLFIVDNTPALQNHQVLERAIDRYLNCWLPLASKYTPRDVFLPPLDCAWVWHCHKLNPVQYAKDCQQQFGKLVDVGVPLLNRAPDVETATIDIWKKSFPGVPYHFIRHGQRSAEQEPHFYRLPNRYNLAYDLLDAMERQTPFYFQVCRPWMYDDRFLKVALDRYRGFLHLVKLGLEEEARGGPRPFLVPTYDIDLLWHSHQLRPTAYTADTVKCMGGLLDHDDSDNNRAAGAKLHTSFEDTCEKWQATFGMVYEHAGSLYKGSKPATDVPPAPNMGSADGVVLDYQVNQREQPVAEENKNFLQRQTMQVNLVVFSATNVPPTSKSDRTRHLYVRISALQKCPGLRMFTRSLPCSLTTIEMVEWNEGFSFETELSTLGLHMDLISISEKSAAVPNLASDPKCIGWVSIRWQRDLLNSSTGLCVTKSVPLAPLLKDSSSSSPNDLLQLHFSISITPPIVAPYIFRMIRGPVTDDTGLQVSRMFISGPQNGRWITISVVDHTGKEQFVFRTRWASGAYSREAFVGTIKPKRVSKSERIIKIHEGPLKELTQRELEKYPHKNLHRLRQPLVQAPPFYVVHAHQLDVEWKETVKWSFFNGAATLTVRTPGRTPSRYYTAPSRYYTGGALYCDLQGNLGYPVRLLSGRWLEYKVANSSTLEEEQFLTLVRYTPDAPMGKATALINWSSFIVEVKPEESAALVLLIANAISLSLLDMEVNSQNVCASSSNISLIKESKTLYTDGHLGAMQIQRNGLSDRWTKHSSMQVQRHGLSNWWSKLSRTQDKYSRADKETMSLAAYYTFPWWELDAAGQDGKDIFSSGVYGAAVCGGGACCGSAGGTCGSAGGCGGGCGGGGGGGCGGGGGGGCGAGGGGCGGGGC